MAGSYGYTGKIVDITVAKTGEYEITAYGAQGGGTYTNKPDHPNGGNGARISGQFALVAGEKLEIVVSGQGGASLPLGSAGGGGGGHLCV